ncbi:MAG: cyclic-di-AMP receptor [Anaerolineae bacterium]|nr:cyclic-di-AMP receptor [Anaerolineae bacterium]
MKLIIAIVQNRDADITVKALTNACYVVTRLSSVGGFLHERNTTLFIGVDDAQVDAILGILRKHCHRRIRSKVVPLAGIDSAGIERHGYIEVEVGGATVFVLNVEHFEQI